MVTPELVKVGLEYLRAHITGQVIVPGDADYDAARQAWNLAVEQRPAVIVVAKRADDIAEAVQFARAEGMGVAVMATGHGVARLADGGLLIVTSQMTGVQVDAEAQTAVIEAGTQWGIVLENAQAVGLAPLLGSSPGVGAIGYTLGGGIGWLARKYGLSADSVVSFEVVAADGSLLHVSADENSDLFWALRGGGGSFGIVASMTIKLYPVTTVYAGNLFYPASEAKAVMRRYREWIVNAPDALTSAVLLMNFPQIPEMPDFLRGQSFVMVRGAYTGSMEQGEELLKFWREWQTPAVDMFGPLPFAQAALISNDPIDPIGGHNTTGWLTELSDEAIDTLIQYGLTNNGLMMSEIRHVGGGAIASADRSASAYSNRDESLLLSLVAAVFSPDHQQAMRAYTGQIKRDLQPYLSNRVYMNFLEGEEHRARVQDGYAPEHYQRLAAVKAQYDPQNVFSYSFNIQPAVQGEN